jgi:hypothetical protein
MIPKTGFFDEEMQFSLNGLPHKNYILKIIKTTPESKNLEALNASAEKTHTFK